MKRRNFLKSVGAAIAGAAALPVLRKGVESDVIAKSLAEQSVQFGVSHRGVSSWKQAQELYGPSGGMNLPNISVGPLPDKYVDGGFWYNTMDGRTHLYVNGEWNAL